MSPKLFLYSKDYSIPIFYRTFSDYGVNIVRVLLVCLLE